MHERRPRWRFDVSPKPGQTRRFARAGEAGEAWPQPWQVGRNASQEEIEVVELRPQPWQVLSRLEGPRVEGSRVEEPLSDGRSREFAAALATASEGGT